jgi:hypothetical protein
VRKRASVAVVAFSSLSSYSLSSKCAWEDVILPRHGGVVVLGLGSSIGPSVVKSNKIKIYVNESDVISARVARQMTPSLSYLVRIV